MRLKNIKNADEKIKESKYLVINPEQNKGNWNKIFDNNNPIYVEIGMGKGNFIIGMALKYPNINFVGIEMYNSVILRAIQKLEELEIPNLRLISINAMTIDDIFKNEIDRIYLNFSDPWPKDRHYKRRLTNYVFLEKYDKIFKDKKEIFQKTDNINLFNFSLESLSKYGYELRNVTNDLYSENVEDNVQTEYEEKFVAKNIRINRLEAYK